MTNPWDINAIEPVFRQVALLRLRYAASTVISPEVIERADVRVVADHVAGNLVAQLRGEILAEQLPPQTRDHLIRVEQPDPRHATWWDMWKDTHRDRWWAAWFVRRRPPRYVDTIVAVSRIVTVTVRPHWTYPQARIRLPEESFGSPVMVALTDTTDRWP